MSSSVCCSFSASVALHRIFIAPHIRTASYNLGRSFSSLRSPSPLQGRSHNKPAPTARQLPFDEMISFREIQIVNEDNSISDPQFTRSVLRNLDRNEYRLQVVSVPNHDNKDPDAPRFPLAKVLSKRLMMKSAQAAKKQRHLKNVANTEKKIELNWAIDGNDLGHRLKKAREFLEKGFKVEIAFASKRKGRKATLAEAESVLEKVMELVKNDEGRALGWKQWREPDGEILRLMSVFLEGKATQQKDEKEPPV